MPKERITAKLTYKPGAARVPKELLPDRLPYMAEGATVAAMELRAAGAIEVDGEEMEFQDVRVCVRMSKEASK